MAEHWLTEAEIGVISNERVQLAVTFMARNTATPLTDEDMAASVGLSARQLDRLFRLCLNESPAGFFRKLRLYRADWLLRNTGKTIVEIAAECGFVDSSHLTKRYKNLFGRTPGQTRLENC